MFVCLFVWALDIVYRMDHSVFQGFSLKPKVFGIGNTASINPGIGGGNKHSVLIPYSNFKSLHHIHPAQHLNLVPKKIRGTSAGF